MMNLADILSDEVAMNICNLLEKPFHSVVMKRETAVITFSTEEKDGVTSTEYLEINPSGEVNRYSEWSDSEVGDIQLREVNALPITDYLRKEGFEFTY